MVGGEPAQRGDEVQNGFYLQPTLITGNNSMRFFREEIFRAGDWRHHLQG